MKEAIYNGKVNRFKNSVEALIYLSANKYLQLSYNQKTVRGATNGLDDLLSTIHEKSQKFRYGGDRNSESIYLDSEECKNHLQMLNFLFEKGFGETLKDLITQTAGNRDFGFLRIIPETIKEKINNYPSEVLNDGLAISILN